MVGSRQRQQRSVAQLNRNREAQASWWEITIPSEKVIAPKLTLLRRQARRSTEERSGGPSASSLAVWASVPKQGQPRRQDADVAARPTASLTGRKTNLVAAGGSRLGEQQRTSKKPRSRSPTAGTGPRRSAGVVRTRPEGRVRGNRRSGRGAEQKSSGQSRIAMTEGGVRFSSETTRPVPAAHDRP